MSAPKDPESPAPGAGRREPALPGGLWISLTVAAVGLVMAGLAGVPQKGKPVGGGGGKSKGGALERSLFVWDGSVAASPEGRLALIEFALERGIGQLLVEASAVGYGEPGGIEDHTALVEEAHAAGILVVAAGGFPWWSVPDDAALPNQPTGQGEGWAYYQAIAASGVPYDGILEDTEPYLAEPEDWFGRTAERAQDYLDYLHGVRARIGEMRLLVAIPFWYDQDAAYDLALDGSTGSAPLNEYVAGIADAVVVMAYRDFARGPDGILEHTQGELAAGPTIVAVETNWLGDDPVSDKLSFWQEGAAYMEDQLQIVAGDLRREPNLAGLAIQDEPGYRALEP